MKKLLVILDDETANLLDEKKNKSKYIREALKYMSMDITPDTIEGLRASYAQLTRALSEVDSKVDYIAKKL